MVVQRRDGLAGYATTMMMMQTAAQHARGAQYCLSFVTSEHKGGYDEVRWMSRKQPVVTNCCFFVANLFGHWFFRARALSLSSPVRPPP